ncbi:hypothetical protein MP228_012176 [Amoeboaphelidium protococcarum]|nr:hypothetical protein MP228_012176 [Amoeboaphelidium protococcarum]
MDDNDIDQWEKENMDLLEMEVLDGSEIGGSVFQSNHQPSSPCVRQSAGGSRKRLAEESDAVMAISFSNNNPFAQLKKKIALGDVPAAFVPTTETAILQPLTVVNTQTQLDVQYTALGDKKKVSTNAHGLVTDSLAVSLPSTIDGKIQQSSANVDQRFSQIPESGSFIISKSSDGGKLYFPLDLLRQQKNILSKKINASQQQLLSSSIYHLTTQVEAEQRHQDLLRVETGLQQKLKADNGIEQQSQQRLLTDKYRPQSYMDLVTDEWVNSQCMSWLKQWDFCVFKKQNKSLLQTPNNKDHQQMRHTSQFAYQDKLQRPEKKILMLSGRAGLGKTTLAHVIAKQCGYNVIEVNASDERSGEALQQKIMNALQSKSSINSSKPNLLILDEIDGALGGGDKSLLSFLIKLCKEDYNSFRMVQTSAKLSKFHQDVNGVSDDQEGQLIVKRNGNMSGEKKYQKLLRPIICICNDAYAPALKSFKSFVQHYQVKEPSVHQVVRRLQLIVNKEDSLQLDKRTLTQLTAMFDGDVRSVLNWIDFQHSNAKTGINQSGAPDAKSSKSNADQISIKDRQPSIFKVWDSVFCNQKKSSADNNLQGLLFQLDDIDMVMNGCFQYAPSVRYRDLMGWGSNLMKVNEFTWLYDQINARTYSSKASEGLAAYSHYPVKAYQLYCSMNDIYYDSLRASSQFSLDKPQFEFPRLLLELRKTAVANMSTFQSNTASYQSKCKSSYIDHQRFVTEYLYYALKCLAVNVRGVNVSLLRQDELSQLRRVASLLLYLGLNLKQQKNDNGTFVSTIEPQIDTVCKFDGLSNPCALPTNFAVRQLIAKEINDLKITGNDSDPTVSPVRAPAVQKKTGVNNALSISGSSSHVLKKDFFGRVIRKADDNQPESSPIYQASRNQVKYRFHDGFSNAVRRKVTVKQLLNM